MPTFSSAMLIEVGHSYFSAERGRHLQLAATSETRTFIERHGMMQRSREGTMHLVVDQERLRVLAMCRQPESPEALEFLVGSTDPLCLAYTQVTALADRVTVLEANTDYFAVDADADEVDRLQSSTVARSAGGKSPGISTVWTVLARIRVPVSSLWGALLGRPIELPLVCRLRFEARACHWKYLFFGDYGNRRLSVIDAAGRVEFGTPEVEELPDASRATVIRSMSPLPLEECPTCRFQLLDVSSTPARVLIRRLPSAAPGRAHREWISGEPVTVSEIFINP